MDCNGSDHRRHYLCTGTATRVAKNEENIDRWSSNQIEQTAILKGVSANQTLLMERALKDNRRIND